MKDSQFCQWSENAKIQFVLFREYFWKYVPIFDIQLL